MSLMVAYLLVSIHNGEAKRNSDFLRIVVVGPLGSAYFLESSLFEEAWYTIVARTTNLGLIICYYRYVWEI